MPNEAATLEEVISDAPESRRSDRAGATAFVAPRDHAMRLVEHSALQAARSDETILLLGETGVGKDVMARRIHDASSRRNKRFVQINCAALPDGLLESELFGHVRGAFTGAVSSQPGQFEVAAGGTIFLDEIGELSPLLQAKLLHVLQEKMFCRVGGREPIRADVRVIAATNQDLDRAMTTGAFRRDLYYRLSVVCLRIPPLRERRADITELARFFAFKYASLYNRPGMTDPGERVLSAMGAHPFEGNVRELENLMKRAMLLGTFDQVLEEIDRARAAAPGIAEAEPPARPMAVRAGTASPVPLKEVARCAVVDAERRAIVRALTATRWNRRKAADLLQISYRALLYKIRDYAILPLGAEEAGLLLDGPPVVSPREGSC